MNKISVLVFAKHELRTFEQVLSRASNPKFCDQLLVVLDDQHLLEIKEIAKKYHADIYIKKLDNFRDHKNFGISKAKNNWVLLLDADELIDEELADSLENFRLSDESTYRGYNIKFKTYFFNHWLKYGGVYPDIHIRLFDKRYSKYKHIVHELLYVDGKIGELNGHILHYSVSNFRQWLNKISLYNDLEAKYIMQRGRKFSLMYLFGKPVKEFYWRYIQLYGYRDGWHGIRFALMSAYYRYKTALRLKKLEKEIK